MLFAPSRTGSESGGLARIHCRVFWPDIVKLFDRVDYVEAVGVNSDCPSYNEGYACLLIEFEVGLISKQLAILIVVRREPWAKPV